MKKYLLIIILLSMYASLYGQFGKNKVQYENYDWKFIQGNHFDIYYYGDNKELAEFTAKQSEEAYISIKNLFDWPIQKRYSIIIYDSHNAFQQNNVIYEYIPEGVGGVTELFKNRVLLPFEGSYRDFRHVIHHELIHAIMNDMYYGGNVQSLVSGTVTLQLPDWLAEGSAEYESVRWDIQTDMFMRDLAFSGRMVPIEYLSGYYNYKAGQSIFRFIDETYGQEKITEFYGALKSTHSVERAIRKSFNMTMEEFNNEWYKWLKKEFWTDVELTQEVGKQSVQLTDHLKDGNYQNVSPSISPSGSKVIFMSDRSGYADIYRMDVEDGTNLKKVVGGQRKASLEELKWLSPGISWSHDSKHFVFAAKSGNCDALIVVDDKTKKQKIIKIESLRGIYSAAWHPKINIIAFEGNSGTRSDIYLYDIKKKTLVNLTDDDFADKNPHWNKDGSKLIYVSERDRKSGMYPERHPYQNDLYEIDVESRIKTEITHTDFDENYPLYDPQGRGIIYTSDANGISNIYVKPVNSAPYPITNVIGGVYQLDLDASGKTLVFSAFQDGGWDIYRLNDPFLQSPKNLLNTKFRQREITISHKNPALATLDTLDSSLHIEPISENALKTDLGLNANYRSFIFLPKYRDRITAMNVKDTVYMDTTLIMNPDSGYYDNDYKTKFSLDLVDSQMGYSTFYGFQGMAVFLFSDVLGDHQFAVSTELYVDLKNSDYALTYFYLKHRMNYGFSYFNYSDYYYTYLTYYTTIAVTQYRNYGLNFMASYPVDRYQRIDFNQTYFTASRKLVNGDDSVEGDDYNYSLNANISSLAYVFDNVLWSYTAPMDGARYRLQFDFVPDVGSGPAFNTLSLDFRKYWKKDFDYHFAARLNTGTSWGKKPQKFMVGGVDNWLNYSYNPDAPIFGSSTNNFTDQLDVYYFSQVVTPVRGTRYFEKTGNKFFTVNLELRYPFLEYAKFRFPLPINLYQVRGVYFIDFGAAWDNQLKLYQAGGILPINNRFEDLIGSTGFGLRIYLGYFILRIDNAWQYSGTSFSKPRYLFSIGGDL